MEIGHIAMYVDDLEGAKAFFMEYFAARPGKGYHNPETGFCSYFLAFDGGARLEIMHRPGLEGGGKRPDGAAAGGRVRGCQRPKGDGRRVLRKLHHRHRGQPARADHIGLLFYGGNRRMKKEPIPIQIEYRQAGDGVEILRLRGRAAEIRIPEEVAGMPVTAVAERAFAAAGEAPEAKAADERPALLSFCTGGEAPAGEGQALKRLSLPDSVRRIGAYAFADCTALERLRLPAGLEALPEHMLDGCTALERLSLPPGLEEIGGYVFYNCRALRALELPEGVRKIGAYAFYNCRQMERVNIPLAAVELNTGLFLNCDRLREISFGQCRHISDLISVLNHELWLTIDFPQEGGGTARARLILPDFQYEYIEDTPARQFHQVNYGTGHIFRQCVGNSEIDFRRYDEIFYLTRREDAAATVLLLAMGRLEYPYKLEARAREAYLDYIRGHLAWAAGWFLERGEPEKLRLFAEWGLLTEESLPEVLEKAQAAGNTEAVSFLMDYRHRHFGGKRKKTFEL